MEQAQNDSGVVLGMFPVNFVPATVLFDSGASHYFITDQFVTKHNLSMSSMKNPLVVSSPGGEMKTGYICTQVKINIMGVDFLANLVVLKSWGIDIILGMDWLQKHDGVIQCQKKLVLLTSPQGERIEYVGTPSSNSGTGNLVEGKALEDIKVVVNSLMCFQRIFQVCHLTVILNLVLILYLVLLLYQKDLIECMLKI
jgi:hypothetical protein